MPTEGCHNRLQSQNFTFAATTALVNSYQLALFNIKFLSRDDFPFMMPLSAQSTALSVASYCRRFKREYVSQCDCLYLCRFSEAAISAWHNHHRQVVGPQQSK